MKVLANLFTIVILAYWNLNIIDALVLQNVIHNWYISIFEF